MTDSNADSPAPTAPAAPSDTRTSQIIEFDHVSLTRDDRIALNDVTLRLSEFRIGIVGLNGSGKSTLLKSIVGLVKPTSGALRIDGRDVMQNLDLVRRSTGFVFQNPDNQIVFPVVAEDLAFGLKKRGLTKPQITERIQMAMQRLSITALAPRRIHELSGGEKQLVALAGVLAVQPKTILFDEPTSQLDLRNRNRFRDTLAALPEQALVVAHDLELLSDFDRVLVIDAGRIILDGAPSGTLAAYRERNR